MGSKLFLLFRTMCFASVLLAAVAWTTNAQPKYTIVDIGTFGEESYATALNSSGHVVGYSRAVGSNNWRGFIWRDSVLTDLGALGTAGTWAWGINDSDEVTGESYTNGLGENGGGEIHAFRWSNGAMTDLGTLGGRLSRGYAINNAGTIVGESEIADSLPLAAFRSNGGSLVNLGIDNSNRAQATGINGLGAVIGWKDILGDQVGWLFDGGITLLGSLGGGGTYPRGINNQGDIVGSSLTPTFAFHAFLWSNGVMIDLGGLPPLGQAQAISINSLGEIVGFPGFLYKDGQMMNLNDLIPPGTGWTLSIALAINDSGMIAGWGMLNGQSRAFLLRPDRFRVTSPAPSELWIAGTQDTIRWTGGPDTVDIQLDVEYAGGNGELIDLALDYPADSNYFVWKPPDTLLSRKCKIQIVKSGTGDPSTVSENFRIKGFELTRLTPDNNYERFNRGTHDWSFGNLPGNLWPSVWWSQFQYQVGIDPYTGSQYPQSFFQPFLYSSPSDFPDWPVFVRAFGTGQCYLSQTLGFYNLNATFRWRAIKNTWGGSCSGMALSSLLAFDRPGTFSTAFPEMPTFTSLNQVSLTNDTRKVPNQLWIHWFGNPHRQYVSQKAATTPNQTINELKQLFASDNPDNRYLYLANNGTGGGAHAIVPFKVEHDTVNQQFYWIHVYDNSYNTTPNTRIRVDTTGNSGSGSWISASWPGWGGNRHLYLMDQSSLYLTPPILVSPLSDISEPPAGGSPLEIFPPAAQTFAISDTAGNTVGFVDSVIVNSIPEAVPLTPPTGSETPPYSYLIPPAQYTVRSHAPVDSVVLLSVFSDSLVYCYLRTDATPSQRDDISIGAGVGVVNADADPRTITLQTLILEPDQQKLFHVSGFSMVQGDSAYITRTEHDHLKIRNLAAQKSYSLMTVRASATSYPQFAHQGIDLPSNSSHELVPDWTDLGQPVTIYVDLGNNGTIDDTLFIDNILDVDEHSSGAMPTEFALLQNYPNPFNPSTTIRYQLLTAIRVTVKIFDLLGREVATLVDEPKPAGTYEVVWNGHGINGQASSGVYVYQLRAGATVISKKMLLVR